MTTATDSPPAAELVKPATKAQAKARVKRIRAGLEHAAKTVDEIKAAWLHDDWRALDYDDWAGYVAAEYADVLPALDRAQRRAMVTGLDALGMTTRAIAPVVGASKDTVRNDLADAAHDATGENSPGAESNGQSQSAVAPAEPKKGLNGKAIKRKPKPGTPPLSRKPPEVPPGKVVPVDNPDGSITVYGPDGKSATTPPMHDRDPDAPPWTQSCSPSVWETHRANMARVVSDPHQYQERPPLSRSAAGKLLTLHFQALGVIIANVESDDERTELSARLARMCQRQVGRLAREVAAREGAASQAEPAAPATPPTKES